MRKTRASRARRCRRRSAGRRRRARATADRPETGPRIAPRLAHLVGREQHADHPEHLRHHHGADAALERAGGDQRLDRRRDGGGQRGDREAGGARPAGRACGRTCRRAARRSAAPPPSRACTPRRSTAGSRTSRPGRSRIAGAATLAIVESSRSIIVAERAAENAIHSRSCPTSHPPYRNDLLRSMIVCDALSHIGHSPPSSTARPLSRSARTSGRCALALMRAAGRGGPQRRGDQGRGARGVHGRSRRPDRGRGRAGGRGHRRAVPALPAKEELLQRLAADGLERYVAELEAALADEGDPWEAFAGVHAPLRRGRDELDHAPPRGALPVHADASRPAGPPRDRADRSGCCTARRPAGELREDVESTDLALLFEQLQGIEVCRRRAQPRAAPALPRAAARRAADAARRAAARPAARPGRS